ncbi:MAG: hypothetical protein WD875_00590 [Pirellulales bacterium]
MIRGIALAALMVSIATIGLVAITRPEVFGQAPGEPGRSVLEESPAAGTPRSILEESLRRHDATSGDENAGPHAAPGERGTSSPHDSPEALYAEFVAACATQKPSRVAACLSPDSQATMAMTIVAAAMELEFDPQRAEPVRKALAAHGIDPKSLPAQRLSFDYRLSAGEDIEKLWQDEVMPRIRNVPDLIADLEPLLQDVGHKEPYYATIALEMATFDNQKFGFLRNLNLERDSATAIVRTRQFQQVSPAYASPSHAAAPAYPAYAPTHTAWKKISFTRIDGKWYLAKFDEIIDESAANGPPVYDPSVNDGPPGYTPPIAPSGPLPLPGPPR